MLLFSFYRGETEAQRDKTTRLRHTALSGWAGTRSTAVWLQSLNTKLPLCAFRRLQGPRVPSNGVSPLQRKPDSGTQNTARSKKCSLEAASLLGSGFRASVRASNGDLPSAVISWPDMGMTRLMARKTMEKMKSTRICITQTKKSPQPTSPGPA